MVHFGLKWPKIRELEGGLRINFEKYVFWASLKSELFMSIRAPRLLYCQNFIHDFYISKTQQKKGVLMKKPSTL